MGWDGVRIEYCCVKEFGVRELDEEFIVRKG